MGLAYDIYAIRITVILLVIQKVIDNTVCIYIQHTPIGMFREM